MFGRRNKLDSDRASVDESKKSDRSRTKEDKDNRRKRENVMDRFRENGYDSGFVYHED